MKKNEIKLDLENITATSLYNVREKAIKLLSQSKIDLVLAEIKTKSKYNQKQLERIFKQQGLYFANNFFQNKSVNEFQILFSWSPAGFVLIPKGENDCIFEFMNEGDWWYVGFLIDTINKLKTL
jgi:hypothetical protein